jgi:hypothetical protein
MNINDLTIGQLKEIKNLLNPGSEEKSDNSAWEIGEIYLIRTVTMIDTGRLVKVTNKEIILEDAAWIADTGRFSDAIKKAEFNEVEPFPDGKIGLGRGAIIDFCKIKLSPRSQK